MDLVVEDGILRDLANSYASVACADDYCVPRGLWPATAILVDDDGMETPDGEISGRKEACLMRAFDWLNTLKWKGERLDWEQAGAWPRKNVPLPGSGNDFIGYDVIPLAIVRAQCEIAALIFNGTNPLEPLERGGMIKAESHSAKEGDFDVIGGDSKSDSYTWADNAPVEAYFPAVIGYLRPFLKEIPGESSNCALVEAGRG